MTQTDRRKDIASLFNICVSVIGLASFAYSACALAFNPVDVEWALLGLVTVLIVSRIDIGIARAKTAVNLSDTFVFIAALLFGTHAAVVLAGVEAAAYTLQVGERRRRVLFNSAATSLSIFVAS